MVRRFGMMLVLMSVFVASAPAATGGEYPQKAMVATVAATIPCASLKITRDHVIAVNSAVKADATPEAFLPRFDAAVTRLPAVIAASPSIMRSVFTILRTQFTEQRDRLVEEGQSPELYALIINTSDSMLTLFPHVQCT